VPGSLFEELFKDITHQVVLTGTRMIGAAAKTGLKDLEKLPKAALDKLEGLRKGFDGEAAPDGDAEETPPKKQRRKRGGGKMKKGTAKASGGSDGRQSAPVEPGAVPRRRRSDGR
jgi:hypothetical protein